MHKIISYKKPLLVLICIAIGSMLGCSSQPYVTPERLDKGKVIVLTGIEGSGIFNQRICKGLDEGGVPYAIELCDWTNKIPLAYLLNLNTEKRNRRMAMKIAEDIVKYKREYPGRPVFLVGQSGGGAMAVWICEYMSWGQKIDGAFLLAAAISQEYPLSSALVNTRRGIVNYYSPRDVMFLGVGTIIYGTMDRKHESAAGRLGFRETENQQGYDKLFQVEWTNRMSDKGNIGGHLTSGTPAYVATYIAPLIKENFWSQETIKKFVE